MLSCSDLASAKRLSIALGYYRIIASNSAVILYLDGTVQTSQWYQIIGNNQTLINYPQTLTLTPPIATTDRTKFVRLGPACPVFDTSKNKAISANGGMLPSDAELAIDKLCNLADASAINAELFSTNFSDAQVAAFFRGIIVNTTDNRHIANNITPTSTNITSTFGLEQLKAWKKLYTSGFETDFEYIRTLSDKIQYTGSSFSNYSMIDMTTCTVVRNGAINSKNITVTHGSFNTDFVGNEIRARGGTGNPAPVNPATGTDPMLRNQLLNIVPLIPEVKYIVENSNNTPYVTYTTDAQGRVKQIEATLTKTTSGRRDNSLSSLICNRNGPKEGKGCFAPSMPQNINELFDNGGHMIAAQFDGPVELINYFAQNAAQNQQAPQGHPAPPNQTLGLWFSMETEWDSQPTGTVRVDIKPQFSGSSRRPFEFVVDFSYGGGTNQNRRIPNP